MKIFFVLTLVIYFPRSVVLGDVDCGTDDPEALVIADDCLNNFENGYTNFNDRCNAEDAFKNRCTLCCTSACPSGFTNIANDLNGSAEFTELGVADIGECEAACNDRSGCTAFEYNHAGEENYKCGTYTGGESDKVTTNTGGNSWSTDGYQKSTWTSCYKG